MGRRIDVIPPTTFPAGTTAVDVRFTVGVPGGAKSGLLVVNVFAGDSAAVVKVYSASSLEYDSNLVTGSQIFWFSPGNVAVSTTAGVKTNTLSGMADFVRVAVESASTGCRLSVVIYVFDA